MMMVIDNKIVEQVGQLGQIQFTTQIIFLFNMVADYFNAFENSLGAIQMCIPEYVPMHFVWEAII